MKKVVFITGTSSGIGKTIAYYLHTKGFIVYGSCRNPEKHEKSPFEILKLDVRNQETIDACIHHILKKENKIDILINNAGVGITGALEEIPSEEIKNNFETNLFGPIALIKAVLPSMRNRKAGYIINITSIAGYMGLPYRSIYSSSKSALHILTESLSIELKPFDIKVTTVAPGDFSTDIASRRFHTPVEKNSPYYKWYKEQLDTIDDDVNKGKNPKDMAEAIYRIIQNKNPKLHYKVGDFMQKISIFLKAILPDRWFESLLMKHYKIK